jgi:polar amino acid transport system substrate-binding protein
MRPGNSAVGRLAALASVLFIVGACSGSAATPTPAPTPAPTAEATVAASPEASSVASQATTVTPPARIAAAGTIVICSDMVLAPIALMVNGQPQGSDIDIGNAIAETLGVKADWAQTGFDGMIAALVGGKCDITMSGMNDTAERRKQIQFVDYQLVGMQLLVQKGNPAKLDGLTDNLSGKTVGAGVGSSNADYLKTYSDKLVSQGKSAITISLFPSDVNAAEALKTGHLDALLDDTTYADYFIVQDPNAFELAGPQVEPGPYGIGVRLNETDLAQSLDAAVKLLYQNGKMCKILTTWSMQVTALAGYTCQ